VVIGGVFISSAKSKKFFCLEVDFTIQWKVPQLLRRAANLFHCCGWVSSRGDPDLENIINIVLII
jgi:hypothetical protein